MAEAASSAALPQSAADEADQALRAARRRKWYARLAMVVALAGAGWLLWYVAIGRNHVSTDNAYVNAEMAQVTPLVAGAAIEVRVKDTQAVRRGEVLVVLDPVNARIALAQAEAELASARRRFAQTSATSTALSAQVSAGGADIARAQAQLASASADLAKAEVDLQRRQALAGGGAVSGEELTVARRGHSAARAAVLQAQASVEQARSARQAAQGQLSANEALVSGSKVSTDPAVQVAAARVAAARLDLERTVIRAPVAGVVTRRQIQLGQRVAQGAPIMTIVPIGQLYVDANFKEGQLRRVRIGMPARVTADIYGSDVVFRGRVAGIAGGTGASMALIPAQNATGNWIKVVQRLPVRIELDPRDLVAHPLRVGLSAEVEIDLGRE